MCGELTEALGIPVSFLNKDNLLFRCTLSEEEDELLRRCLLLRLPDAALAADAAFLRGDFDCEIIPWSFKLCDNIRGDFEFETIPLSFKLCATMFH